MALSQYITSKYNKIIVGSAAGIGLIIAGAVGISSLTPALEVRDSGGHVLWAVNLGGGMSGTSITTTGTISGSHLFAGSAMSGAGLTDCDTATTSKLLWDATTERYSCGVDQSGTGGGGSGQMGTGNVLSAAYFDTASTLSGTHFNFLGDRLNIFSGGTLHADSSLTSSGSASIEGMIYGNVTGALTGNASTASALAANGANCPAGQYPLGVDGSGAVEDCTVSGSSYSAGQGLSLLGTVFSRLAALTGTTLNLTGNLSGSGTASIDGMFYANAGITGALTGNASTATALAGNGANCAANQYPLGVDASGAVESCTADANTTYTAGEGLSLAGTIFSRIATITGATLNLTGNLSGSGTASIEGMLYANVTGALTGNASTATALAANPNDCSANQFATTIAASGDLTCSAIADADVPNSITIDNATTAATANAGDSATAFFSSGTVEMAYGGTAKNMTAAAGAMCYSDADSLELTSVGGSGAVLISQGTSSPKWKYKTEDQRFIVFGANTLAVVGSGSTIPLLFSGALVNANYYTEEAGSGIILDILFGGTSVFTTKLTTDNREASSSTALTPFILSSTASRFNGSFSSPVLMTFELESVGTVAGTGGILTLQFEHDGF